MPAYGLNRVVALAAVLLITAPVHAQPGGGAENVVLAVPNVALTFAPGYLAEDLGLFAKHGLNLKSVVITGIGSANAVISGSADFAQISGATLTRAAARGQRLLGIVGTLNRPVIQIVLRKEIAAAAGFDPKAPLERRAQVLRSRTIAVDSSTPSSTPMCCCWRGAPAIAPTTSASPRWRRTAPSPHSRRARSTVSPCRCRGPCRPCWTAAPS